MCSCGFRQQTSEEGEFFLQTLLCVEFLVGRARVCVDLAVHVAGIHIRLCIDARRLDLKPNNTEPKSACVWVNVRGRKRKERKESKGEEGRGDKQTKRHRHKKQKKERKDSRFRPVFVHFDNDDDMVEHIDFLRWKKKVRVSCVSVSVSLRCLPLSLFAFSLLCVYPPLISYPSLLPSLPRTPHTHTHTHTHTLLLLFSHLPSHLLHSLSSLPSLTEPGRRCVCVCGGGCPGGLLLRLLHPWGGAARIQDRRGSRTQGGEANERAESAALRVLPLALLQTAENCAPCRELGRGAQRRSHHEYPLSGAVPLCSCFCLCLFFALLCVPLSLLYACVSVSSLLCCVCPSLCFVLLSAFVLVTVSIFSVCFFFVSFFVALFFLLPLFTRCLSSSSSYSPLPVAL